MVYKDCKYFKQIDISPWHGDVFEHPNIKITVRRMEKRKNWYGQKNNAVNV